MCNARVGRTRRKAFRAAAIYRGVVELTKGVPSNFSDQNMNPLPSIQVYVFAACVSEREGERGRKSARDRERKNTNVSWCMSVYE